MTCMASFCWLTVFLVAFAHSETIDCSAGDCACSTSQSGECVITCDGVNDCRAETITCRDGDDCSVECTGRNSCKGTASVICGSGAICTVTCDDKDGGSPDTCEDLVIDTNSAAAFACNGGGCPATPEAYTD